MNSFEKNVVRVQNTKNSSFGTGFPIEDKEGNIYVVTCTHVLDNADSDSIIINGLKGSIYYSSPEDCFDITIIKLESKTSLIIPKLGNKPSKAENFLIGFSQYGKFTLEQRLNCKLVKNATVHCKQTNKHVPAWNIEITENDKLNPGYSGAPVFNSNNEVFGIITYRKSDGVKGLAVSISAIEAFCKIQLKVKKGYTYSNERHSHKIHEVPADIIYSQLINIKNISQEIKGVSKTYPYKYGEVAERRDNSNRGSEYIILDENGISYQCTYADILTEGFRTLKVNDKVRFIVDTNYKNIRKATYILKLEESIKLIDYKPMNEKVKKHYDELSTNYDNLWTYSKPFVEHISKNIISLLYLKNDDILVDYGCGTGIYTKAILQIMNLKNEVICTDLSEKMLESLENTNGVKTIAMDAISFSNLDINYDKVFIKEMIHHIENGKEIIYQNIFKNLNPNGIFIILLLPPTIEYPLFNKALNYYEAHQPHYQEIANGFEKVGFVTDVQKINYPLEINKKRYFNMVSNRYMSLLSQFSDDEIEKGIFEMEEKYKNVKTLRFNDTFIVVRGKKI